MYTKNREHLLDGACAATHMPRMRGYPQKNPETGAFDSASPTAGGVIITVIFHFFKIDCFTVNEYENVFIAGQNRRAGCATEAFCSRSAVIPIMVIFYISCIILSFIHCLMELQMVYPVLALQN